MSGNIAWAARKIVKRPLSTLLTGLTLCLGFVLAISVFSVVKQVLLEPLPFEESNRIVKLTQTIELTSGPTEGGLLAADVEQLRQFSASFESVAFYSQPHYKIRGSAGPQSAEGLAATASICQVLRIRPAFGRCFSANIDRENPQVAMVSWDYWREAYPDDQELAGKTVVLDDKTYDIVGVLPPGCNFPTAHTEFWTLDEPASRYPRFRSESIGRLLPGATLEQARQEIARLAPDGVVAVRDLREELVADVRPALLMLMAGAGLVFLISCVNVMVVLLAGLGESIQELSIRTALGAGTRNLLQQSLWEAGLVSGLAGGAALAVVFLFQDRLLELFPVAISGWRGMEADPAVFLFAFGCCLVTGIVFGSLPVVATRRKSLTRGLRADPQGLGGLVGSRFARIVLLAEMVLALVLVNTSGLLVRSFLKLTSVDPGYQTQNVLSMALKPPPGRYEAEASKVAFFADVANRLGAIPHVSAAVTDTLPLVSKNERSFFVPGRPPESGATAVHSSVTPQLFSTVGIRLLAGRTLQDSDDGRKVAVVNRTLSEGWFNGEAVGKRLAFGSPNGMPFEIVGVVGDVRQFGLEKDAPPHIYHPFDTGDWIPPTVFVMARVDQRSPEIRSTVVAAVQSLEPAAQIENVAWVEDRLADSLSDRRFWLALTSATGLLGLLLTVVGVYGLASLSVVRRRTEIGLRMALGASPGTVIRDIAMQACYVLAPAVPIAWVSTRLLGGLLSGAVYGITSHDPKTFVVACTVTALACLLGHWIPAAKASKLDPALCLRHQ